VGGLWALRVRLCRRRAARHLSLSPATVGKHLEHVYDKLGVQNRTAAVAEFGPISG